MMRMLFLIPLAAALTVAASLGWDGGRAGATEAPNCGVPRDLLDTDGPLPAIGARLRAQLPVTIVAIGGASTAGTAVGEANAYPNRLQETLQQQHPGAAITVLNKGKARQTAQDMTARFATDVFPATPALVIWEVGAVDAARDSDVEEFAATLKGGIDALREHGAEIMLVDLQYNPSTNSVINFAPYLDALHRVADLESVPAFKRFDIMKYWSDTGVFDFVDVPLQQRVSMATGVYRCLGENMAEAIGIATQ
jgi:lysophospholipase L1-like esterase